MESLKKSEIIYDAKCAICGAPVTTPEEWREHGICKEMCQSFKMSQVKCPDCGSINLQPQGGCLVCLDCSYCSCGG